MLDIVRKRENPSLHSVNCTQILLELLNFRESIFYQLEIGLARSVSHLSLRQAFRCIHYEYVTVNFLCRLYMNHCTGWKLGTMTTG